MDSSAAYIDKQKKDKYDEINRRAIVNDPCVEHLHLKCRNLGQWI